MYVCTCFYIYMNLYMTCMNACMYVCVCQRDRIPLLPGICL